MSLPMSQAKYQITLSLDGNHSVSVTGDDPTAVKEGLAWARGIYLKLQEKAQPSQPRGAELSTPTTHHHDLSPAERAPDCAIHHQPMTWMNKNGGFWSCHKRLDDGSWCPYRPPK
jgi:hypothetical protein